jgi:hypothetical protein
MHHILLAAILAAATSARAEPVPGLDDPAFRAPFDRALQGDDPTALADLHAAASAGNQAALLALPAVLTWLPPTGTLAERNRFRRVNGTRLEDAVAAISPTAAAWADGQITTPDDLLTRARALAADQPLKAATLLAAFLNMQDPSLPPPADLLNLPISAMDLGLYLSDLIRSGDPAVADPVLIRALQQDQLAAWIALARITESGTDPTTTPRIAALLQAANIDQPTARVHLAEAALVADIFAKLPLLIPRAQAETVARLLRDTPEFLPLRSLCAAACPASATQCEAASFQAFGYPYPQGESAVPEPALIAPKDFYATPRGASVFMGARLPRMHGTELFPEILAQVARTDACLAKAIAATSAP